MALWIWHPEWTDTSIESAGALVHFRKTISISSVPSQPVYIQITADTKYKLYINSELLVIGPVKGDQHMWFYDEVDIRPFLKAGGNDINVQVLRLHHATSHATSFPRLPQPGLLIRHAHMSDDVGFHVQSDKSWETVIDFSTRLPTNMPEDQFLQIYEQVDNSRAIEEPGWLAAKELDFPASHGISAPWKLSPRLIPYPRYQAVPFKAIHNIESTVSRAEWEKVLLAPRDGGCHSTIFLPAGSRHRVELEAESHITAYLQFRFQRPFRVGSSLKVTYSESYEDMPEVIPWIRRKGNRLDTTKRIRGPEDQYFFGGIGATHLRSNSRYHQNCEDQEIFSPFHFRTFRFLAVDIEVTHQSDLVMDHINLTTTNYPLEVLADINVSPAGDLYRELWSTSIRTLTNCMHDCYEDCPFYEQLQYVMDARSSALFTYCVSGDDRLARQAILQIYNSFQPSIGLTASRAPAHQLQIIPHFSLFWIAMVTDHFEYFNDIEFVRQFIPVCDGVLESFARRTDPKVGLVRTSQTSDHWDFVDWAESWKPMGIPPAAERSGFQAFTNMLYTYSLRRISAVLIAIGRPGLAEEYEIRANSVIKALKTYCFDGRFFTDGLSDSRCRQSDYSQTTQAWAVLCGAATDDLAVDIMAESTAATAGEKSSQSFTPASTAMSFYILRALSMAGGGIYEKRFHSIWEPWKTQLKQNLTTWVEDNVSNRSDCHAWGCSPLFEMVAEVAGVRMGAPGWEVIDFQPRVSLFSELNATIPFVRNGAPGLVCVQWQYKGDGFEVSISFKLDSAETSTPPVRLISPDGHVEIIDATSEPYHRTIKSSLMGQPFPMPLSS
ncbi:Alpha-L-rhamnosidase [Penicillium ucsense]|uniref:Alpha-L-rhamnosidase n=1 Tax=Penicillium ucsense TaxID=2839758 RepID=A0A8J8WJ95_9EURO|nr:Alpha-L-rhamnosidase [Penicillium ucsense]KAF7737168.1 Alpha-L-rhamnosidase [Penicillium ucsense]